MANFLVWVIWLLAAGACLATGVRVVTASNPFSSALSLIGNLASLAVLFLLASGEFVAAAQILVYAGAVMVMFLFVIAYLGGRADAPWAGGTKLIQTASVISAASLLAVTFVALMLNAGGRLSNEADVSRAFGSPAEMGRLFLTDHLLAFEITSIVLLVAAVGGVVLGMRSEAEEAVEAGEGLGVNGPGIPWYLAISAILFSIGVAGVLLRRSPLIVLLSLEIMLNAANLAFVGFSRLFGEMDGQVFALAVMAVAAAEVCVGLGLIVAMARRNLALDVDQLTELRG